MKKFLLLAICALSVCLTGCSDNDTPEQLPDPELTLAPDAPIAFPAEGGSVEITVTTNMEVGTPFPTRSGAKSRSPQVNSRYRP